MSTRTVKYFFLYFGGILGLLFGLTLFIVLGFTELSLTEVLLERAFSSMSLFFYILMFAFLAALIMVIYLHISHQRRQKKITSALRMLNEGQYSANIFLHMFSEETPVQISQAIDQEILKLHEKMMLISEEAASAQQVSAVSNEAREEILETERHRIARELHDSVSQQLFASAMLLSTVETQEEQFPEPLQAQIHLISSIIDDAQSEMRALLLHLRPIKLDGKSLKKGIEQLLDELKSKLPIVITHEIEDITLTEVIEDHIFRIVQELLSNVLRHSQADELEVYLKETENFYQLRFIDDGRGFDMNEKSSSGFGLRNIRERIEGLGGNVRIISFPDQGTSVELRIPLITGG